MTLLTGDKINIGVGIENPSARGTVVTAQGWVPGRTPTGVDVSVEKVLMQETRQSGVKSQGSEIIMRSAQGSLEFNLRSETIGYLLKSLLGACSSTVIDGSYKKHAFSLLTSSPQFPSLTLSLSQAGSFQDYTYKNALVKSLEIKTPVDDLVNAVAEFIATDETASAGHTVTYSDSDYLFRPQDVSIKIAATVANLAAAQAINVKDFGIKIDNMAKPERHLGSVTPTDVLASLLDVSGNLTLNYADTTYHEIFKGGTYKAMEITICRTDKDLGTTDYPKLVLTMPKVSIEKLEQDRSLDALVTDQLEFVAHYDEDEEYAITADLYNTVADYDYDVVS
jgi:hypothetical protein